MNKIVVLLGLISGIYFNSAHAEWSGSGVISDLRLYNGSLMLASLSSLSVSDSEANCGSPNNPGQLGFLIDKPYSNNLLSIMLAAELAGRSVKVYMNGGCVEGRPEINGAWIVSD